MDLTMVDVSEVPGVQVGDEVVLLGRQGSEEISAAEMGSWIESIPYEVLCGIGKRVPRIYRRGMS
jgi:alanine racemase